MDDPARATVATRVLASVASELRAFMPALIQRTVDLITAREANYRGPGSPLPDDLRTSVSANVDGIVGILAEARAVTEADLCVPRSTGRRRAEQGLALESVLRAYRLGGQVLIDALVERAQRRTDEELTAFLSVAMVAMDIVDQYAEAVVHGYRQAEAELRRRDSQRREAAFDGLLDGRCADVAGASAAATALALPDQGPYLVVIRAFDPAGDCGPTTVRDVCAAFGLPTAWRTRGGQEIGIAAPGATSVRAFLDATRKAVTGRIGVSGLFDRLQETPEAYRLACAALLTVPPQVSDVAWVDERLVEALLAANPELAALLVRRTLSAVLGLDEPDRAVILGTLESWYASGCCAAPAAERLGCHRNTVLNRLRRVESLAGLSFDDHRGLLMCRLALMSLGLVPGAARPYATYVSPRRHR